MRRRLFLSAALIGLLGLAHLAPFRAEALGVRTCEGAGQIFFEVNPDGTANLEAEGAGVCQFQLQTVSLVGTGTASSLGLCSGDLLVSNLEMDITATIYAPQTDSTHVEHFHWSAPVSTFPLVTPTLMTGEDGALGATLIFSHIYLNCGQAGGQPSASFNWAQTV